MFKITVDSSIKCKGDAITLDQLRDCAKAHGIAKFEVCDGEKSLHGEDFPYNGDVIIRPVKFIKDL